MRKINTFILISALLGGCSLADKYERPFMDLPDKTDDTILNKYARENWWEMFNDPTLNKLEDEAFKNNFDMKIAVARIDEARAMAGISKSALFPSVNLSGQASRTHVSSNTYMMRAIGDIGGFSNNQNDFSVGPSVSYEIDLFGKIRNSNNAALYNLLSTKLAKDVTYISLSSEVAKLYFTLITLDEKVKIATRTLESRQKTYNIYKDRFKTGYCTELELLRIEAEMTSVECMLQQVKSALAKTETSLAVLIGRSPREIVTQKTKRLKTIHEISFLDMRPKNIHSDLINRRPDIASAEAALMAANANIGAARAAFFPSIRLTGSTGVESSSYKDLFGYMSGSWLFAGNITAPIFNAGKIKYNIEAAKAKYDQALFWYKKTVQLAFKEVRDAVKINNYTRKILLSKVRQKNALKRSFEIAYQQKESGLIGLVDLLDVERNFLAAEIDQAEASLNMLCSVVDLCKSLGGGWKIKHAKK